MATVPYDATRDALFRPWKADNFFALGPVASDSALCAEMARLAYVRERDRATEYLRRAGFRPVRFSTVDGTDAFVAESDQVLVVAFRGTESDDPTDLFADADIRLARWDGAGLVHHGFARGLAAVWDDLVPVVEPAGKRRLLLTGHSLGAALATLAAARLTPDRLYTFGSPRVGDAAFAAGMRKVSHHRLVDCCDIVTRVPTSGLDPAGALVEYVHVGTLQYIDRRGGVREAPPESEIEADRHTASREYIERLGFLWGKVPVRELADHAPINYVSAVMGLRG